METVHYVLDGSTIVSETRKDGYDMVTHQFYYYYDENGAPIGLNWNGQDYYYYKNIFGDVLGIFNSSGSLVVRYTYDAWGNNISRTGSMANTLGIYNPFRYRGYYLDTETGIYYLNARYYNPYWCRFISPDPVIDTGSAVGCNLFAYCGNDPVNYQDPSGLLKEGLSEEQLDMIREIGRICNENARMADSAYFSQYPEMLPPLEIFPDKTADQKKDFASRAYLWGLRAEFEYGIPAALFASQMCLESGYGSSNIAINKNNLFGLMYKGKSQLFDSVKDCINKYTALLQNTRYGPLLKLPLKDLVFSIGPKGYCPSPDYGNKLWNIILLYKWA